ncbi:NAD(P)/FAD-dependent oxidoreductase [bacterium]|nr:MAG: NAD(P)/FAD-dependent oxidoreductase [bacterium]
MAHTDVAIIGGGPAGSTTGSFLRKYGNDLSVLILERDAFPRDHVGESQLPAISRILDEIGCWDKVEAANFPIKVGATYKWGRTEELWDFDFYPLDLFHNEPRPGRYEGQRKSLAFQVDRAIYDKILLDHARELGCEVRETTRVVRILRQGDRVEGLELDTGEVIQARFYVDGSGHAGILRRAMNVSVEHPTNLQNIAIWEYWRNAEWAEEIGVGATRVQVISVRNGWIWFIPLGPDRTSVGLIVPAAYYKAVGKRPAELYEQALQEDARLAGLMRNAMPEGNLQTTKDWSFLAGRHSGENWFLEGESSGFADPILAAGLTITHASAREAAFTILEMDRGADPAWLRAAYDRRQSTRITNHIRFADYWYSANAQFTELQDHTAQIARDNGLNLDPARAWAWLAQGGFIDEELGAGAAGFALPLLKDLGSYLGEVREDNPVYTKNIFRLDLENADVEVRPLYENGKVSRCESYVREERRLPVRFPYDFWLHELRSAPDIDVLKQKLKAYLLRFADPKERSARYLALMPALEAMIVDGWVQASYEEDKPCFAEQFRYAMIHPHSVV